MVSLQSSAPFENITGEISIRDDLRKHPPKNGPWEKKRMVNYSVPKGTLIDPSTLSGFISDHTIILFIIIWDG